MTRPRVWQRISSSENAVLLLSALGLVLLHTLVNGRYGFHRDELQTFNNARHLAWGYVEYPPITPFLGRLSLELFGTSLAGFRFFPALAHGAVLVLAGLTARSLGGGRRAQLTAAFAVAIGGSTLFLGGFLSYTSLDYFAWVFVAYFVARLLQSDDARWWLAIGAAVGLGLLTKYTICFLILGILSGSLLTPLRHHLRSRWFWCGVALAFLIVLPNLLWQVEHHFVTLDYLKSIHARDVRRGSTDYFLLNQLWSTTNPVAVPFWLAGLWYLFRTPEGRRYRLLGWMYLFPLVGLMLAKGRGYYLAPAYPMLIAAGSVYYERWYSSLSSSAADWVRPTVRNSLIFGGAIAAALSLPLAPLGSAWWHFADGANGNFNMHLGWPEIADTAAKIRASLPAEEQPHVGVWAGDDGEAGAIAVYGPSRGLPPPISGMNSNWGRGYGDVPPDSVITIGMEREFIFRNFESCELVGRLSSADHINTSIRGYEDVYLCRHLKQPWPEFWKHFQYYG